MSFRKDAVVLSRPAYHRLKRLIFGAVPYPDPQFTALTSLFLYIKDRNIVNLNINHWRKDILWAKQTFGAGLTKGLIDLTQQTDQKSFSGQIFSLSLKYHESLTKRSWFIWI